MKLSILFLALFFSLSTWATSGKITKVKGNNAIVNFDGPVSEGELVNVGEVDDAGEKTTAPLKERFTKRDYAFEYQWQTSVATQTTSGTTGNAITTTAATISFWVVLNNFNNFEVAPLLSYSSQTNVLTVTSFGLIGQYDFIKNQAGVSLVPAVYLIYQTANSSSNAGNSTVTFTTNTMGGGGSIDWFPFGERVALNLRVEYDSVSYPSNSATTLTVWQFLSGAKVYF